MDQANISNVPKKDSNGKPIPNTSEGTLVRIRLFDDRERVLFFPGNPSPTAKQVINMVVDKLELSNGDLFALWIVNKDLELQIRPKMELREMVDKWPRWFEKYTHRTDVQSSSFKFVFKREAMVGRDMERALKDEVAIKLLYGEARNNIMSGRYPIQTPAEAARLAAMHLLNTHGQFEPRKHGPGTNFIQESLSVLVPKQMIPKLRPQEWDQKITSAWSNIVKKNSPTAGYKDYLEYIMNWDIYGSTFFAACKNVPPQGYFELRTEHLLVGVNRNGMCIVDEDKYKVSWYGDFSSGIEWEITPDSLTIEFRPKPKADGTPSKKMASTLITPQAHLIDSLASRSIYLIEKIEKKSKQQQGVKSSQLDGKQSPNSFLKEEKKQSRRESIDKGLQEKSNRQKEERYADDPTDYLKAVNEARKLNSK